MPIYYQNTNEGQNRPVIPYQQPQMPYGKYAPVPSMPGMIPQGITGMAQTPALQARFHANPMPPQRPMPRPMPPAQYHVNPMPPSLPMPSPAPSAQQPVSAPASLSPTPPSVSIEKENVLAMAWFEDQKFGPLYDPEKAMGRGTLFPELDKPWLAPQRRSIK